MQPLPRPSGQYSIGTERFTMVDTAVFLSGDRVARPLTAQVWYPSQADGHSPRALYVEPGALLDAMIREKYQDLPPAAIREWGVLPLSASTGAPPARTPSKRGWPVLVFSHGFGVSRISYAAFAQEFASRGYIVITIDHPFGGFMVAPDGRLLEPGGDSLRRRLGSASAMATVDSALAWDARWWSAEGVAALRRLAAGRTGVAVLASLVIDTARAGMLGHSLGGAAALQGCRDHALFRACADMDGAPVGDVERAGVRKPILALLSEPGGPAAEAKDSAERVRHAEFARMGRERDSTWRAIVKHDAPIPVFVQVFRGTAHFSFSDAPFLMPSLLRGTGSTRSARDAYALIVSRLADFFDHFLRGAPLRLLKPGVTTVSDVAPSPHRRTRWR